MLVCCLVSDPAGQAMHVPVPDIVLYVPLGHAMHELMAWSVEYLPASQSVHDELPEAILYFPATQVTQGPPPGPVYPGSHAHRLASSLPGGELDPDTQDVQAETPTELL